MSPSRSPFCFVDEEDTKDLHIVQGLRYEQGLKWELSAWLPGLVSSTFPFVRPVTWYGSERNRSMNDPSLHDRLCPRWLASPLHSILCWVHLVSSQERKTKHGRSLGGKAATSQEARRLVKDACCSSGSPLLGFSNDQPGCRSTPGRE